MNILSKYLVDIYNEMDVVKARIKGVEIAKKIGFSSVNLTEIEIAISEMGTNIVKHSGTKGQIVFLHIREYGVNGIQVMAMDNGPGIKNYKYWITQGQSSTNTLGIGLSGTKRLMDEFFLEEQESFSNCIVTRKWLNQVITNKINISVFSRPKFGEKKSGDAYFIKHLPGSVFFSIIDALGHGSKAHEVAQIALKILENHYRESLMDIIDIAHHHLKNTRGAAMALCKILFSKQEIQYLSIGNIDIIPFSNPKPLNFYSFNGTLGMNIQSHRVLTSTFIEGTGLIMFSDGISHQMNLEPQILRKSSQEIAIHILNKNGRDFDDATVLVAK